MILLKEIQVKYNNLGVPDKVYKGIIRQTDNFVTRLKIDLTDVPGDILTAGINVKKEDGTTNTGGLIVTYPIPGQPKKFYVDISNWFTNIPGTLEITVQALASMNGLTQVFNCSKITFCIEGTATELDPTVVPEFFNVLSVNGYAGVIDITMTNIGSGAEIIKADLDNNTNWNIKTIKQGSHIEVVENENDITINLTNDIPTQIEVTAEISEHNTSELAHEDIREDIEDVAEDLGLHEANDNAHSLDLVKADILAIQSALEGELTSAHNVDITAHSDIRLLINEARVIAEGKSRGRTFVTTASMLDWIELHEAELQVGDNLYIEETEVPDYWWNGYALRELETDKVDLTNYYTKDFVHTKSEADERYIQQVEGKGLSTNDYTTDEKNKLSGIDAGAEVNVQSDWTQEVNTADDYIRNKPTIPTKTSDLTNDSEFITEEDLPEITGGAVIDLGAQPTKDTGLSLCVNPGLYTFTVAGISYLIEVNLNNETPEQKWIEIFSSSTIAYSRAWYGEEYGWHSFPPQILSLSDAVYWESQVWYKADSIVRGSNNKVYYSKAHDNKDNNPVNDINFTYWGEVDYENVQSDWNVTDTTSEAYVKNKPSIPVISNNIIADASSTEKGISVKATKDYVDLKAIGVYRFKGSVASYEYLPTENMVLGDVWNVTDTGMNYAWDGLDWDNLGMSVDLSDYYNKTEINTIIGDIETLLEGI